MKPNKLFRISEIMWMVISIACVVTDLFIFIIQGDMRKGLFFLGMTAMAGIMYYVRRRMRIRADGVVNEPVEPGKGKKPRK
jgi:hypothetical protein